MKDSSRGGAAMILPLDVAASTADRAGPKAATLARLRAAGLPAPDGVVLPLEAYRAALVAAGVAPEAGRAAEAEDLEARRLALQVRIGLLHAPLDKALKASLDRAYRRLSAGG